jgi:hypothetical protein
MGRPRKSSLGRGASEFPNTGLKWCEPWCFLEEDGYPWSVRLKAAIPLWMRWLKKRMVVTPKVETQLLLISPRQIDPRLKEEKTRVGRRLHGRTKPGTLLKHQVPIKTDRFASAGPRLRSLVRTRGSFDARIADLGL